MSYSALALPTYSFLNRSRSISVGGPDEDYNGCEIECFNPVTQEHRGKAVVVEQIAFASLSHVYKCYFSEGPLEGTVAAAKILTTGYSMAGNKSSEVLRRLYEREVASLCRLHHPHVIGFYGVGKVEMLGNTRQVMFIEFMPGGDARALIDQAMRPMDEGAAGTIILPIAEALGAAHAAGIVHRDVKAGNILLAPGVGQVKLADWGISVALEESSSRMSVNGTRMRAPGSVGTEYWCAPEVERGLPHDATSDVFSLAITFIELVTGRDPKYDNSAEGVKALHLQESGFIPPDLSEEAKQWLSDCLTVQADKRPSIHELLQCAFFTIIRNAMEKATAELEAELGESEDGMNGLPELRPLEPGMVSPRGRGNEGTAAQQAARRAAAFKAVGAIPSGGRGDSGGVDVSGPAPYEVDASENGSKKSPLCGCTIS